MVHLNRMGCCGILEAVGISSLEAPKEMFNGLLNRLSYGFELVPFIIFSGVVRKGDKDPNNDHARSERTDDYGAKLAKFITDNNLGAVVPSLERKSWTENYLKIWIFHPDYDAVFAYMRNEPTLKYLLGE